MRSQNFRQGKALVAAHVEGGYTSQPEALVPLLSKIFSSRISFCAEEDQP